jgi:glycosyltransferase involved in cell wall biosynthesis
MSRRVGYIVNRFPVLGHTFVLREIEAVSAQEGVDIELFSLFPARDPASQPAARRWLERLHTRDLRRAPAALAWWLARRPLRTLATLGTVLWRHRRAPGQLKAVLVVSGAALVHARTVKRLGLAHVHAHFQAPILAAWICSRLTDTPFSFTAHAYEIFVDHTGLDAYLRDARFVAAISEFNRRYLARFGDTEKVAVVHCGLDVDRFAFEPKPLPRTGPVSLLSVGGLHEYKGHDVLVTALADPRLERATLDVVGAGPLEADLRALAAELGVTDRVRFRGPLVEDEVLSCLRSADAFVLASKVGSDGNMEGIPVALMEAMAVGRPVVATDLSGIPELVRAGETGWLAQPADPAALAEAIAALLADPDEAARRVAQARRLVAREFDVGVTGPEMARLLGAPGTAPAAAPPPRPS